MNIITSATQSFTQTDSTIGSAEWFIKLEQEKVKNDAPVALTAAADVIDALFNIDSCSGAVTNKSTTETTPVEEKIATAHKNMFDVTTNPDGTTTTRFAQVMQEFLANPQRCLADDGKYYATIRVYRTDEKVPYELDLGDAVEISRGFYSEYIEEVAAIVESNSVQLKQPAWSPVEISTNNSIITKKGLIPVLPLLVKDSGISIAFSIDITATLKLKYTSTYDRIEIQLPVGKDGKPLPVNVSAYYAGVSDAIDVTYEELDSDASVADICSLLTGRVTSNNNNKMLLDKVTHGEGRCWSKVTNNIRYRCSNDLKEQKDDYTAVACPKGTMPETVVGPNLERDGYVSYPPSVKMDVAQPEFYEAKCCFPPKVPLPECRKTYSVYYGGHEIEGGRDSYLHKYGKNTQIIGMSPVGGKCGSSTLTQRVVQKGCCEGVSLLSWDRQHTPNILPHGKSITVAWAGSDGRQVTVTTTNNLTHFDDGKKTAVGHGNSIQLIAGESFCGNTEISVHDGCSTATMIIRSDLGSWYSLGPQCAFAGQVPETLGWNTGEKIAGKYKQTEQYVPTFFGVPGLFCDGRTVSSGPSGCLNSPCDQAYCQAVAAALPPSAHPDTCMKFVLLGHPQRYGPAYCTLDDGTVIADSTFSSTFGDCFYTTGSGQGGSTGLRGAFFAKKYEMNLFEWRC